LVYSTCSLSPRQNEAIVSYLLEAEGGKAVLDPIMELGEPFFSSLAEKEEGEGGKEGGQGAGPGRLPCRWGSLPGTLVFEPRFGETSGLFIARIRKKEREEGAID
jgi:16S rRNA C967 or C1407 C5-methylase (RsmB/RsmF family)